MDYEPIKLLVKLDGGVDLTLLEARAILWKYLGIDTAPPFSPPLDGIVLALGNFITETKKALESFETFKVRFEALEARERVEHRPVSGRITFGRPVKGVVSFPH